MSEVGVCRNECHARMEVCECNSVPVGNFVESDVVRAKRFERIRKHRLESGHEGLVCTLCAGDQVVCSSELLNDGGNDMVDEKGSDGVPRVVEINRFVDDRGVLDVVFGVKDFPGLKRQYLVRNGCDVKRAFHGHKYESKFLVPVSGRFKVVCAKMNYGTGGFAVHDGGGKIVDSGSKEILDLDKDSSKTFYLCSEKPCGLFVPAGWAHGFRSFGEGLLLVSSDKTLEESKSDDIRFAWDSLGKELWEVEFR